jgi:hypothetical protein
MLGPIKNMPGGCMVHNWARDWVLESRPVLCSAHDVQLYSLSPAMSTIYSYTMPTDMLHGTDGGGSCFFSQRLVKRLP